MAEMVEITVGVIGRAHGIRGDVNVEVRTDEIERRFSPGQKLRTDKNEALTVAGTKNVAGRMVVTFTEIVDRTQAEGMRGRVLTLEVPEDELPSGDDEYFDRQLIGLTVLSSSGVECGEIVDVSHMPAQDLLVISVDEGERLVPFVHELVPEVDLNEGFVRLADVPGLLDDMADES